MNIDNIKLDEEDAKLLREFNNHRLAVQSFVQTIMQAGETRTNALLLEGQQVWSALAKKYSLDVNNIQYDLAPDGSNELKIMGVRFP